MNRRLFDELARLVRMRRYGARPELIRKQRAYVLQLSARIVRGARFP